MVFAGGAYAELDASHEHFVQLHERGVPVVLINAAVEHLGFPAVSTDDAVAIEQAFAHLRSLGHQRFGIVLGPRDHVPSQRKLEAFHAAAVSAGIPVDTLLAEHVMFSVEGGQVAGTRLVAGGVTGIICASDPLALGVIRAVRRARLNVPDDISVVGFDDSAFMNCTDPPLTTVRQPIESMGRAVVTLLGNQIDGAPPGSDELLFEPELVVRGSTGPMRPRTPTG
jgi:DNA-binding LacI/PurR family transcriptional regulator